MANALYDSGKELCLSGLDWASDQIRAVLVDSADYTPDLVNHTSLADIPSAGRVATADLTGKTITAGLADADDVLFQGVSGDSVDLAVVYRVGVDEPNSELIALHDTVTGLPLDPSGTDWLLTWPVEGVFQL